ncbi:MAG: hypothetical protein L0241_22200 [Planctomycetia bacterium]|nr:hypothetical protein [Planctomycetia bacterium]
MRTGTFALVGLCLVLSARGLDADEFKPFASSAGRYKILFPGPVKTQTTDIKAGKDTLKLTLDLVELKGDTVFLVSFVDTSEAVAKQPPGPRLNKVRDGNKGENGKVLEDKDVTIGSEKYPGRDVLIETPKGYIRNRIVIAGNRLYQVMIQGSKEVVTSESADKFLASFEITK